MNVNVKFENATKKFNARFGETNVLRDETTGSGLPNGGKAGQYLRKKSDADGDVEWADMEIPKEYGLVTYDQNKTITIR